MYDSSSGGEDRKGPALYLPPTILTFEKRGRKCRGLCWRADGNGRRESSFSISSSPPPPPPPRREKDLWCGVGWGKGVESHLCTPQCEGGGRVQRSKKGGKRSVVVGRKVEGISSQGGGQRTERRGLLGREKRGRRRRGYCLRRKRRKVRWREKAVGFRSGVGEEGRKGTANFEKKWGRELYYC